jgi:hypothetical protein
MHRPVNRDNILVRERCRQTAACLAVPAHMYALRFRLTCIPCGFCSHARPAVSAHMHVLRFPLTCAPCSFCSHALSWPQQAPCQRASILHTQRDRPGQAGQHTRAPLSCWLSPPWLALLPSLGRQCCPHLGGPLPRSTQGHPQGHLENPSPTWAPPVLSPPLQSRHGAGQVVERWHEPSRATLIG